VVENRLSPLLWPLAYTTACTTVQAVMWRVNPYYVLSARKRRKQVFISLVNAAPQPIYAGCISEFLFWNLET